MKAAAVIFDSPQHLSLGTLALPTVQAGQVEVAVQYSGISMAMERMLWDGSLPRVRGLHYPLVPGYETVGRVVRAGDDMDLKEGQAVFVSGANCFSGVTSLYGAAASRLVASEKDVLPVADHLGADAVLMALAATAYHAVSGGGRHAAFTPPDLIIGHSVMGRLLARLTIAAGFPAPTVWETQEARATAGDGYNVIRPSDDPRQDYQAIYDVSGDATDLDLWLQKIKPGGDIVLAGFYRNTLQFSHANAFGREPSIRMASEWTRSDLLAVNQLVNTGRLSLAGLITHTENSHAATKAYQTAFGDISCLKMVLDWSTNA